MESSETLRGGVYYTPRVWVEEAHRSLEQTLGPSWKDDCIVWDSACGRGSLTAGYIFSDLIQSTIEPEDVEFLRAQDPHACLFRYDFLNDEEHPFLAQGNVVPAEVQERLTSAAKAGRRLVFFINPPYVDAGPMGISGHETKAGVSATQVSGQMTGLGRAVRQLYTQFLFRIAQIRQEYGFEKITVAFFSKPAFMCSGGYHAFRQYWYEQFAYQGGFMFQAKHFPGVTNNMWAVSFTLWSEGKTLLSADLPIHLKGLEGGVLRDRGEKHLYSAVGREASKWVQAGLEGKPSITSLAMTSGLKVQEGKEARGVDGAHAYLAANGNSLSTSWNKVYFLSCPPPSSTGITTIPVFASNIKRVCAYYAARKAVGCTWVNDKDEYLAPNEGPGFDVWSDNALIYATFHWSNNCTSLPDVQLDGTSHAIRNCFYWRTTSTGEGTLVSSLLPTLTLWEESKQVLDIADEMLDLTQKHRWEFDPMYHLERWDAGVYQLKFLWKEHTPSLWEDFQKAVKALESRLAPGVFTFGFLR